MRSRRPIKALPFAWYYVPSLVLVGVGLVCSVYLSVSHYRVYTDIAYSSFCAISKAINCDTVSQSPYSVFLGFPVPMWGVAGYSFLLTWVVVAGLRSFRPRRFWATIFLFCTAYSVVSVVLALVSTFRIHSYCIVCIVTYGVNFLLAYYAWLIRRRFDLDSLTVAMSEDFRAIRHHGRMALGLFGFFCLFFAASWVSVPPYWTLDVPGVGDTLKSGLTEEGHPWIGAEKPDLTISEYADYRCFQCRKMHFHLRKLVSRYPDRIRLVHHHYPMDHLVNPIVKEPMHEGSAAMALLAIQAASKGKFWEANDELYRMAQDAQTVDTKDLAEKIGLDPKELVSALKDPEVLRFLLEDIRKGMRLEIRGTPSYEIDGTVYEGQIPESALSLAIGKPSK